MRLMFSLFLWLTPVFVVSAQSSLRKLERVQLFGHEYVRLADWAAANNFELKWIRPDEELEVKSTWAKLIYTVPWRLAMLMETAIPT